MESCLISSWTIATCVGSSATTSRTNKLVSNAIICCAAGNCSQSTLTLTDLQSSSIGIGIPSCLSSPIKSPKCRPDLEGNARKDKPLPIATKDNCVPTFQCNSSRISLGMTIWPLLESRVIATDIETPSKTIGKPPLSPFSSGDTTSDKICHNVTG